MSAFSATEQDESSQLKSGKSGVTTGTAGKKRRSFWSWMRSRPTYMSFATFFMLFCGGLLTSGLGPALPIIEHQCNTFAIYIPTQPNTHLSSLFFGATAPQVGPATSSLDVTSAVLQGLVRAFLFTCFGFFSRQLCQTLKHNSCRRAALRPDQPRGFHSRHHCYHWRRDVHPIPVFPQRLHKHPHKISQRQNADSLVARLFTDLGAFRSQRSARDILWSL